MTEHIPQIEQTEDQAVMPILVEREKLRWKIEKSIWTLLLCGVDQLSAKFILELQRDLEEWEKCPSV